MYTEICINYINFVSSNKFKTYALIFMQVLLALFVLYVESSIIFPCQFGIITTVLIFFITSVIQEQATYLTCSFFLVSKYMIQQFNVLSRLDPKYKLCHDWSIYNETDSRKRLGCLLIYMIRSNALWSSWWHGLILLAFLKSQQFRS